MMLRHPPQTKLADWLEHGADQQVDAHVTVCARCAARLEAIARPTTDLRAALSEALQPPTDLVARLQSGVRTELDRRKDLGLLAGLLGLSWQTTRILMDEESE